jgi:CRP/FNR family transcriptional regulator, cyclic AMP receptor protein
MVNRAEPDRLKLITACPLFRGLDASVLEQLAAVSYMKRYADGAMIHAKGDPPEGLFGVICGKAKVSSIGRDGRELLFTILESGSWFGEVSLFDGQGRSHDIYAMEATEFLLVPIKEFHRILQEQPHLYPHFLKLMCGYIRMSYTALEDHTLLDLSGRLAKRLLTLADQYGVQVEEGVRINMHLPREELARMLAASRQSVSTEMNNWERQGWLELKYGRVLIRDRKALEKVVDATPRRAGQQVGMPKKSAVERP